MASSSEALRRSGSSAASASSSSRAWLQAGAGRVVGIEQLQAGCRAVQVQISASPVRRRPGGVSYTGLPSSARARQKAAKRQHAPRRIAAPGARCAGVTQPGAARLSAADRRLTWPRPWRAGAIQRSLVSMNTAPAREPGQKTEQVGASGCSSAPRPPRRPAWRGRSRRCRKTASRATAGGPAA